MKGNSAQKSYPRFAIMNECDGPCRRMICEFVDGVGYCYMARDLKQYDGMTPERPTAIEEFGFRIEVKEGEAVFRQVGSGTATYADGERRKWQGYVGTKCEFTIPLVRNARRARKARG